MEVKTALVCGAGGFIGHHLVSRLKKEGFWVRGVDLKYDPYSKVIADDFLIGDLRNISVCERAIDRRFDQVYQLAADMGGAGYLFVGYNDAEIMHNSALINLNVLNTCYKRNIKHILYSSSACVYPEYNQLELDKLKISEDSTYPAEPDSEYGWEKLFSERLYMTFHRCHNMEVKVARIHNIFGPECSWNNGKEKAPAALCRKIAMADENGSIDIWGDGNQIRSFLYVDECVEGLWRLMNSNFSGPVNVGSEEFITIDNLARLIMEIANKKLTIEHIPGPIGVAVRSSDNKLIKEKLGWAPSLPLHHGLEITYQWVAKQLSEGNKPYSYHEHPTAMDITA